MNDLKCLKQWLRSELRKREPNVFELEEIYRQLHDIGYRVEYPKGGKPQFIRVAL